jgi:dynein heavy chain 2
MRVNRETLLGQMKVYIRQIRDEFQQRTSASSKGVPGTKNLPEMVNQMIWVRQLEAKV